MTYATAKGRTLLDRELYLPQVWVDDQERREEAGVPEKWRSVPSRNWPGGCWNGRWSRESPSAGPLGTRSTAMTATCGCGWSGETFPTCWPSRAMRSCGLGRTRVRARCGRTGWRLGWREPGWVRRSAGDGAKGPRVYDWARVEIRPLKEPGKGYWLLVRRSVAKPEELAYYVCYGPAGTTLKELVRVAGTRVGH